MSPLMLGITLFKLAIRSLSLGRSSLLAVGWTALRRSLRTLRSLANLSSLTLATDKSVLALSRSTSRVLVCLLRLSTVSWRPLILAWISAIVCLIVSIFFWLSLMAFSLAVMLAWSPALVSLASCNLVSRSLMRLSVAANLTLSFVILFLSSSFCLVTVCNSLS